MTRPPPIERLAPERPKFSADLLLIPGLWCRAASWRRMMGYFAHRGWQCLAVELDRSRPEHDLAHYRAQIDALARDLPAPPILIGHDLGGSLVLGCAAPQRARIALAPLSTGPAADTHHVALHGLRARLRLARNSWIQPPTGAFGEHYFSGGPPGGTIDEPAAVLRQLRHDQLPPTPVSSPTLVLAGEHDTFSPASSVERWARGCGADFIAAAGAGHALPWEGGWEKRVGEIHRWLIQTLGEPLLLPAEDED